MTAKPHLVVVGNGMAGARFVEDLIARGGGERYRISVYGDEPCGNYNRILLSGVLAGTHKPEDIFINPLSWYEANGVTLHAGIRVEAIDVRNRLVTGSNGATDTYARLVLATGSRPLIPPIAGLGPDPAAFKRGVFVFRTLADCDRMLEHAKHARRAAVIGGGLLGLEAARGLLHANLEVHVIHLMPHLMETQLDGAAGGVLQRQLEQLGLHVHLSTSTMAVLGDDSVTGLAFKDGSTLDCDMVVAAAGIRPNVELAVRAGLAVDRGILVGDDLACEGAADVFAIGECAQHRGRVYGLVAPLWEQAQVLADRLSGKSGAVYSGSRLSTKLKVAGVSLAVMGHKDAVEEDDEVVSYAEPSRGIYKKLIVRDNRLAGAIVVGDGAIVPSLFRAFTESTELAPNRAELLFRITDETRGPSPPDTLPDTTQICNCNNVTKAQIIETVLEGANSLGAVCALTRAGTGCGSCKPEVQAIVEYARQGLLDPEVLKAVDRPPQAPVVRVPEDGAVVVTFNKMERFKNEKDGLDIIPEIPKFAREGWQAIEEGDRERLKWAGVFFRRQTPGRFMMRVRMANGLTNSEQMTTLAGIAQEFGTGFVDITTRQQMQLRGYQIDQVPEIWRRLEAVGLGSLQTGQDNVRNIIGCPMAGLSRGELFDASPVARQFTDVFLRNKAYTNLPRKFNVAITGCTEECVHAESQDLALTPAVKTIDGRDVCGFNVAVGGKMGSGGYRIASALDVFVAPEDAAALCSHVTLIFRDHGSRASRTKARLAFLVDAWGTRKFRAELQRRMGRPLQRAGVDKRAGRSSDHLGVVRQKQAGLNSVGLTVPVGRITAEQMLGVARLADAYGDGCVRLTIGQNVIVPNVPDRKLADLLREPLLGDLQPNSPGILRGLVSCTGIDYCHFALVETKELALKTAHHLRQFLPHDKVLTMHWSGCPAGCGNHAAADIGLLGKNIKVDGEVVEAVDVFVNGRSGANARPGTKLLEDVPCEQLPQVLERVIPYLAKKAPAAQVRASQPAAAQAGA